MYSRIDQNRDKGLPTAVLYSAVEYTGDGWEPLRNHSCGGFSCDSLDGWAYLLPLCAQAQPVVQSIAEESFCEGCANPSMDYFGGQEHFQEQQAAYRKLLGQHGLTVGDALLSKLKQAAYPLDATRKNLQALVGDNNLSTIPLDGLVILVLGDNCD